MLSVRPVLLASWQLSLAALVRFGSFATEPSPASVEQCPLCADSDRHPSQDRLTLRSSRAEESHPRALPGRVEDWRAGLGRSLCSLLPRPFVCECHTISTMPRFQPPPRRTQHADFLALRSPVCFASRLMGPILPGRLSTSVAEPGIPSPITCRGLREDETRWRFGLPGACEH
jgi:hypothetical protein